jgi:hypothetical protein
VRMIWPVAGRGRPRKRHVPDILSMAAEDMLAAARWQNISWRTGTKGKLKARFAAVRVRIADLPSALMRLPAVKGGKDRADTVADVIRRASAHQLRERIRALRRLSLEDADVDYLKERLFLLFKGYAKAALALEPGQKLYRAVKRNEKPTRVEQISYPPANV